MFLTYDGTSGKGAIGCAFIPIYRERQAVKLNLERHKEMVEKFKMARKSAFQSVRR